MSIFKNYTNALNRNVPIHANHAFLNRLLCRTSEFNSDSTFIAFIEKTRPKSFIAFATLVIAVPEAMVLNLLNSSYQTFLIVTNVSSIPYGVTFKLGG